MDGNRAIAEAAIRAGAERVLLEHVSGEDAIDRVVEALEVATPGGRDPPAPKEPLERLLDRGGIGLAKEGSDQVDRAVDDFVGDVARRN